MSIFIKKLKELMNFFTFSHWNRFLATLLYLETFEISANPLKYLTKLSCESLANSWANQVPQYQKFSLTKKLHYFSIQIYIVTLVTWKNLLKNLLFEAPVTTSGNYT